MSSLEKHHNKKKLIFNGGNYLLTPINKKINSLNFLILIKMKIIAKIKMEPK